MSEDSGEKKSEMMSPYKGEIVDYPGTGRIVVVIGYHKLEREWGQIVREQFQRSVKDDGQKAVFFEVQDSPVDTGKESPTVNAQIARFIEETGNVEMIIDIHEHPEAQATRVRNQWSLTTVDQQVINASKDKIKELRTLPFDDYSRRKTGGRNIPYAISDPDLPTGGKNSYSKGKVTPQMREAINDVLSFIVTLSNTQLESSSKKSK